MYQNMIQRLLNNVFFAPEDGTGGAPAGGAPAGGAPTGSDPSGAPSGDAPAFPKLVLGQPDGAPAGADPTKNADGTPKLGADGKPIVADPNAGEVKYFGAPADGKYADLTYPEGFTPDTALLGKFTPLAQKLGLSQAGMQELSDFYSKEIVGASSAGFVETVANWFTESEKDPEIGGAKWDASVGAAKKGLDAFGTPGLKKLFVEYGIGNHPEVIRFCKRVGDAIAEDTSGGGKGGAGAGATDFLTLMYGPAKTQ